MQIDDTYYFAYYFGQGFFNNNLKIHYLPYKSLLFDHLKVISSKERSSYTLCRQYYYILAYEKNTTPHTS